MAQIEIKNLSFTYPTRQKKALDQINITVSAGQYLLLCGPSGSGKSTLLRQLKRSIKPCGDEGGQILINQIPLAQLDQRKEVETIGFISQNPDEQIVTDKVWHELAFGLESLGYSQPEIQLKIAEMVNFLGIQELFFSPVETLSGGQKQMLNLASVLVMQPEIILLDEPTAQLDPIGVTQFLSMLNRINEEMGITVILSDHRLETIFPRANQVLVLKEGILEKKGTPEEVSGWLVDTNHTMLKAAPTGVQLYKFYKQAEKELFNPEILPIPMTIKEGKSFLTSLHGQGKAKKGLSEKGLGSNKRTKEERFILEAKHLYFKYDSKKLPVLSDLSLKIKKGEILSIVGGNGSGKTTLLKVLAGMNKTYRGKIKVYPNKSNHRIVLLPQDPKSFFIKKTVALDLMEVLDRSGYNPIEKEEKVKSMAKKLRIENLLEQHPYDISGGEQQRLALGKVLLLKPDILLLDEPTKGLDALLKEDLAHILNTLKSEGVTIVMVSHDLEFSAQVSQQCAMLFNGKIISNGPTPSFFSNNFFYTTEIQRIARHVFPGAVTLEDVGKKWDLSALERGIQ